MEGILFNRLFRMPTYLIENTAFLCGRNVIKQLNLNYSAEAETIVLDVSPDRLGPESENIRVKDGRLRYWNTGIKIYWGQVF
jgi:hypothetical protein